MEYKYIQKIDIMYDAFYTKIRELEEKYNQELKNQFFNENAKSVVEIENKIDEVRSDKVLFKEAIVNIFDADNEIAVEAVRALELEAQIRNERVPSSIPLKELSDYVKLTNELSQETIETIQERVDGSKTIMIRNFNSINNVITKYLSEEEQFKFKIDKENILKVVSELREEHKNYMDQWHENIQERLKNHNDLNYGKYTEMSEQNEIANKSSNAYLRIEYLSNENKDVLDIGNRKEIFLRDTLGIGTHEKHWAKLEDTLHVVSTYNTIGKDYSYINAMGVLNVKQHDTEDIVQVKIPIRYYPDVNGKEKFYARKEDYETYVKAIGEPVCAVEEEIINRNHESVNKPRNILEDARLKSEYAEKYELSFAKGISKEEIEEKITKILEDKGPHEILDLMDHITFVENIKKNDPRTSEECLENLKFGKDLLASMDYKRDASITEEHKLDSGIDRIHTRVNRDDKDR